MDRTIHNNAELFDELLAILNTHRDEPGVTESLEYLKAAISLRPQNRFQARQDVDFDSLAGDSLFRELVGSRKQGMS